MQPHRQTLLCRYRYDPLDRLADCTPTAQASSQRFYLKDRLATEIQGARQRSILQHEDQLLAQQQRQNDALETHLLATDQQRSVLAILDATRPHHLAYPPYGHRIPENGLLSLLGFNGERPDPVTGHYLLGNGYRAFNPVLMRFNSPDSWSPFGEGGLNAYGYCEGDPVNRRDPTGHSIMKGVQNRLFGRVKSARMLEIHFPSVPHDNSRAYLVRDNNFQQASWTPPEEARPSLTLAILIEHQAKIEKLHDPHYKIPQELLKYRKNKVIRNPPNILSEQNRSSRPLSPTPPAPGPVDLSRSLTRQDSSPPSYDIVELTPPSYKSLYPETRNIREP